MKRGISIVGIKTNDELLKYISAFPEFCYELSYELTKERLNEILPYVKKRVSSLHALTPRRPYFPNFGSKRKEDIAWSEKMMTEDLELAKKTGADIVVLHPGYMADSIIPSNNRERLKYFESAIYKPYVAYEKGSICTLEYIKSKPYREAFETMVENTARLTKRFESEGVRLAIENLNPRAGYLLIHPDEMIEIANRKEHYLTLDIGHLYVSSALFDLDFLYEIRRVMETGRVVNVHLHSNASNKEKLIFEDSHSSLVDESFPYKEALDILREYDANLILETLDGTRESAEYLHSTIL